MEKIIRIEDAELPNNDHFDMIDVFRFICSIMIMMVHINPFSYSKSPSVISYIDSFVNDLVSTIAVPFFFVTSGFLLFKKTTPNNLDAGYILRYLKRILRLCIIWTIIYFPLEVIVGGESFSIFMYLKNLILTGSLHIWYLNALIFSVAVISIMLYKKIKPGTILKASFIFHAVAILSKSWYGLLRPIQELNPAVWEKILTVSRFIGSAKNGLLFGFFYVSMGMFFAYKKIIIDKKKSVVMLLTSSFLMLVEFVVTTYFDIAKGHDISLFMIPVTFFVFHLVKESKFKFKKKNDLGSLSALMYFTHFWLGKMYRTIFADLPNSTSKSTMIFLLSLVTTILLSETIILLSKKEKFRFLTYLYK